MWNDEPEDAELIIVSKVVPGGSTRRRRVPRGLLAASRAGLLALGRGAGSYPRASSAPPDGQRATASWNADRVGLRRMRDGGPFPGKWTYPSSPQVPANAIQPDDVGSTRTSRGLTILPRPGVVDGLERRTTSMT